MTPHQALTRPARHDAAASVLLALLLLLIRKSAGSRALEVPAFHAGFPFLAALSFFLAVFLDQFLAFFSFGPLDFFADCFGESLHPLLVASFANPPQPLLRIGGALNVLSVGCRQVIQPGSISLQRTQQLLARPRILGVQLPIELAHALLLVCGKRMESI